MSIKELIDQLNEFDFQAYGPKVGVEVKNGSYVLASISDGNIMDLCNYYRENGNGKPTRASLSINIDGTRYFLTRVPTKIDENGEASGYKWCKGKAFRSQN